VAPFAPPLAFADSHLALLFAAALALAVAALLRRLCDDVFTTEVRWLPLTAFTALAAGTPVLYLLARPAVYETAIVAGQCFLFAGIACALQAQRGGRGADAWWMAAAAAWAFAVGSRYSLAPAAACLYVLFVARAWRVWAGTSPHPAVRVLRISSVPAAVAAVLALYNFARYGSWFETGARFVLAGRRVDWDTQAGPWYIVPNLFTYLARPLHISSEFPFLFWTPTAEASPQYVSWIQPPAAPLQVWPEAPFPQIVEPVIGIGWTNPYAIAAAAAAVLLVKERQALRRAFLAGRELAREPEPRPADDLWLLGVFALATAAAAAPLLMWRTASMRYEADFVPLLILLAFVTLATIRRRYPSWRRASGVFAAAGAMAAVGAGVLLSITGPFGHFQRHNPLLFLRLAKPLAPAPTDNLARNGSFEGWSKGAAADPDNWTRMLDVGAVERADTPVHGGSASARYTRTSSNVNAYQELDLAQTFRAIACSAWVYAPDADSVRIAIIHGEQATVSSWADAGRWSRLEAVHFVTGVAPTARVLLDVAAVNPAAAKPGLSGYFDDVECRGVP
jgi:hypothetical protein